MFLRHLNKKTPYVNWYKCQVNWELYVAQTAKSLCNQWANLDENNCTKEFEKHCQDGSLSSWQDFKLLNFNALEKDEALLLSAQSP
jgi:hypothetical protein